MFRNPAKIYRLMLLGTLLLILSASIVSAHSLGSVRNLKIVRKDAGGSNDRLEAEWDHPSGADGVQYVIERSLRYEGDSWDPWGSFTFVSGTSRNLVTVTGASIFDIRVRVQTFTHGTFHATATASLCGFRGDLTSSTGGSCGGGSRGGGSRGGGSEASNGVHSRPPAHTCETLSLSDRGITVYSSQGLKAGIQCQQVGAAGIGIQSIIDAGFIDAVDVWATVNDAEVCFPRDDGSFLFLDAATSPRAVEPLEGYHADGLFCAGINRAGTIVLMEAAESLADGQDTGQSATGGDSVCRNPTEFAPLETPAEVSNCTVTMGCHLNLRDRPIDGGILGIVPIGDELPANARTSEWFQVQWRDTVGWVYGLLTRLTGDCG